MRILFAVICLAIVYGSIYPFNFAADIDFQTALTAFLKTWRVPVSRGDMMGNIALFVPFGFIGGVLLTRRLSPAITLLVLGMIFVPLSLGSQIAQFYLPSRDPTLVDVGWNMLGAFAGYLFCLIPGFRRLLNGPQSEPDTTMPVLLGLLWISSLLLPMLPGLDWQEWKQAVNHALLSPQWQWKKLLLNTAAWVALAHMLATSMSRSWTNSWLPALIVVTIALQLVLAPRILGLSDLLAAAFALMIWFAISLYPDRRAAISGTLLLLAYLILGLVPSGSAPASGEFSLIPFNGFLNGSMTVNASVFCRKLFVYGTLVWLAVDSGLRLGTVVTLLGATVLGVELAQTRIPGRTAEVTDVLIVFAMGFSLIGQRRSNSVPAESRITVPTTENFTTIDQDLAMPLPNVRTQQPRPGLALVGLIAGLVSISAGMLWALKLPITPHNLKTLLAHDGSLLALIPLSLAILLTGAGACWAAWAAARSRVPWLIAPIAVAIVTFVIYLLSKFGLTARAMADITGGNSYFESIKNLNVFGLSGEKLIDQIGEANAPQVLATLEPAVRFSALFGPVVILFMVALVSVLKSTGLSNKGTTRRTASVIKHYLVAFLYMSPWLLLCLIIENPPLLGINVDDITELFSGHSVVADLIRGFLLITIITASAALLGWALSSGRIVWTVITVLICAAAVFPTWYILNQGMPAITNTLELTYPGSKLLQGTDEQSQVSKQDLMIQWGVIQLSVAAVLAFGATLFLLLSGRRYAAPSERQEIAEPVTNNEIVAPTQDAEYSLRESAQMPTSASLTIALSESQQTFLADLSRHMGTKQEQTLGNIIARYHDMVDKSSPEEIVTNHHLVESGNSATEATLLPERTFTLPQALVDFLDSTAQISNVDNQTVIRALIDHLMEDTKT